MNKLIGGAITVALVWLVGVKMGLLDLVVGGIIGDFAAELNRLSGPLAGLLVALAVPVALVGLGLCIHRAHRALGIELMVVAAALIFGSRLLPVAASWSNSEAGSLSASLSHSSTLTVTAPAPVVGR